MTVQFCWFLYWFSFFYFFLLKEYSKIPLSKTHVLYSSHFDWKITSDTLLTFSMIFISTFSYRFSRFWISFEYRERLATLLRSWQQIIQSFQRGIPILIAFFIFLLKVFWSRWFRGLHTTIFTVGTFHLLNVTGLLIEFIKCKSLLSSPFCYSLNVL